MIKSMTGFGHGECEEGLKKISIDIKSVNGKYLDLNIKMYKQFLSLEENVRKALSSKITRGSVDVYVSFSDANQRSEEVNFDMTLAKKIKQYSELLTNTTGIPSSLSAKDLLGFPNVLTFESTGLDLETIKPIFLKALDIAIIQHDEMRQTEGKALQKDLLLSIKNFENNLKKLEKKSSTIVREFRDKIQTRVKELLSEVEIDESKLLNEVTFFADKSDVNEEIVRLKSHVLQFRKILDSNSAAGKQLEFLCQELLRETNTIGSKANNLEITNLVLAQKNILEQIKEQVRNVE